MSACGAVASGLAFLYALYIVIMTLMNSSSVQGWSSLATLITFFSGLILLCLGIIGEYLWRIFDSLKARTLYIVKEIIDETIDTENNEL